MVAVIAFVVSLLISIYVLRRRNLRRNQSHAVEETGHNDRLDSDTEGPIPGIDPFIPMGIEKPQYFEKALEPPSPRSSEQITIGDPHAVVSISDGTRDGQSSPSPQVPIRPELQPELRTGRQQFSPDGPIIGVNGRHSAIAVLLESLNREISMLPPREGRPSLDSEEPPEYRAEA